VIDNERFGKVMKGKTRIWIGMVLLFASGIAVGFAGSGLILRRQVREFVARGPEHMNTRIVAHAIRGMELSEDQRAAIDSIVEETTPEMRKLSVEFGDTMETLATRQFDRIKEVLDEEQGEILEKRMERFRKRIERGRGGPRRPRPPHRGTFNPGDRP
jgi:hypothetical protein